MVAAATRANDMNPLVATLEPVLNKRKQHAVLFIRTVEEGADMA